MTPDQVVEFLKWAVVVVGGLVAGGAVLLGLRHGKGSSKPVEGTVITAAFAERETLRGVIEANDRLTAAIVDTGLIRHQDSMLERMLLEQKIAATKANTESTDRLCGVLREAAIPRDMQGLLDRLR